MDMITNCSKCKKSLDLDYDKHSLVVMEHGIEVFCSEDCENLYMGRTEPKEETKDTKSLLGPNCIACGSYSDGHKLGCPKMKSSD